MPGQEHQAYRLSSGGVVRRLAMVTAGMSVMLNVFLLGHWFGSMTATVHSNQRYNSELFHKYRFISTVSEDPDQPVYDLYQGNTQLSERDPSRRPAQMKQDKEPYINVTENSMPDKKGPISQNEAKNEKIWRPLKKLNASAPIPKSKRRNSTTTDWMAKIVQNRTAKAPAQGVKQRSGVAYLLEQEGRALISARDRLNHLQRSVAELRSTGKTEGLQELEQNIKKMEQVVNVHKNGVIHYKNLLGIDDVESNQADTLKQGNALDANEVSSISYFLNIEPLESDKTLRKRVAPEILQLGTGDSYHVYCSKLHPPSTHAIYTMATGDDSARMATALLQSLEDVRSCKAIAKVVLVTGGGRGSRDCIHGEVKGVNTDKQNPGACHETTIQDPNVAVSKVYLQAWKRLGAEVKVVSPLALSSEYVKIPGGRQHFWGMALNKLMVFNETRFKKILWLDSDIIALKNLDHLLFYPELTAAFTNDCCNIRAPLKISGGMWVIEPRSSRMRQILKLLYGESQLHKLGLEPGSWHYGDMSVMLTMFANPVNEKKYKLYPFSIDPRQGSHVGYLNDPWSHPTYQQLILFNQQQYDMKSGLGIDLAGPLDITTQPLNLNRPRTLNFVTSKDDKNLGDWAAASAGAPQGRVWHMLNSSYDWLPGECICMPERDMGPDFYFSVHFSCIPMQWKKPAVYPSLRQLEAQVEQSMPPCLAFYFKTWINAFNKAMDDVAEHDPWIVQDAPIS